jgi:hypothetical protein
MFRQFLQSVEGLGALIRVNLSAEEAEPVLEKIESLAAVRSDEGEYFLFRRLGFLPPGKSYSLVMDLPSWIELYREGILTDDYQYENLDREIIEVLLEENR